MFNGINGNGSVHCNVIFAGTVNVGGVVSDTVIVCDLVVALPHWSVAVQVFTSV